MRKLLRFLTRVCILLLPLMVQAQNDKKCKCPKIIMYVYDSNLEFNLDKNPSVNEGSNYVGALNSGVWLDGDFNKQRSEDFESDKGLAPGANHGQTVQYSPPNGSGPDGVDFTSSVTITRSKKYNATWHPMPFQTPFVVAMSMGTTSYLEASKNTDDYTYTIQLKIFDAATGKVAADLSQSTDDLGKTDDLIEGMITSISPVDDYLRQYQARFRDQSQNTKWIYLKWKATQHSFVTVKHSTDVNIHVFDCYDEKPAPNQTVKLSLSDPSMGTLEKTTVVTDASGVATAHFTAGSNGGDVKIIPTVLFDQINGKQQSVALHCDQGPPVITILPPSDKWLVSFSYTSYESNSSSSATGEGYHITQISGSGSMFINASAPGDDGFAVINTGEGDSVTKFSVSAAASEKIYSVSRDLAGAIESKEMRIFDGSVPGSMIPGMEFQTGPDGTALAALGFSFDRKGTYTLWNRDENNRLVSSTSDENDVNRYAILLGHSKDNIKKTKDGFTIDYTEKKDTSYTDASGHKTTRYSSVSYHATIMWPTAPEGKGSSYIRSGAGLPGKYFYGEAPGDLRQRLATK